MRKHRALAAFLLALAPALALAQEKAPETISDSWYVVKVDGKTAGHAHELRVRRPEGSRILVETTSTLRLVIEREGSRSELATDEVSVETADGAPLRFEKTKTFSAQPSIYKGSIEGGKLTLASTIGGATETRVLDWDKDAVLDEGTRLRLLAKRKDKGARFTFKTFSTTKLDFTPTDVEIGGTETIDVHGKKVETTRIHSKNEGVEQDAWYDEHDETPRVQVDLGGLVIVMERTTRAEAESQDTKEGAWSIKMWNRSDSPLPHARAFESLTVRIERPSGGLSKWIVPTTSQTVLERDDRSVTLRVTRAVPDKPATLPIASTPELAPLLTPEPYIQSDDPAIVAKAKELRGNETDSLKVARAIAGFVSKHISKKNYDTGYASAKEAFESREGDCTEHSVLLVALLRAAGIPAQLCSGFLGTVSGAFGGHAWASAWVGAWVDLDATLGDAVADAARIKLDEGRSDAKMETGPAIGLGKLTIQVQGFTRDGKATATKPLATSGASFDASALGVAFSIDSTKGWTWKPAGEVPAQALAVATDGKGSEITVGYEELPETVAALSLEKAFTELLHKPIVGKTSQLAGHEAFEVGSDATGVAVVVRLAPTETLQFVLKGKRARKGFAAITGSLVLGAGTAADKSLAPRKAPAPSSEPVPAGK